VLILGLFGNSILASASSAFVVVNNNNLAANSLGIYALDTSSGKLTLVSTLETGGLGLGEPSNENPANLEQAISPSANCIFALDSLSSDIASFSAETGYSNVGNYSDPSLGADYNGGSLALTPNGKYLYASYSTTTNIGAWAVNSDCSLTLVATYPSAVSVGPLKVSPNGNALVVPLSIQPYGGAEMYSVSTTDGTLTDLGFLSFNNPHCVDVCNTFGLDFTKDSKFVVIASNVFSFNQFSNPIAIVARVTPAGLANPRSFSLENTAGVTGNQVPFFGAAGYAGSGSVYFGMRVGVVTANFTEAPLGIAETNATHILAPVWNGSVTVTGSTMVLAEYPNIIATLRINSDGSLTQLSTTQINTTGTGAFSLSLFPSTR